MAPVLLTQTPTPSPSARAVQSAAHLRAVVDRRVGESRFRAALTQDLLGERHARRLPAPV